MTSRLLGNKNIGGIVVLGIDPTVQQPMQALKHKILLSASTTPGEWMPKRHGHCYRPKTRYTVIDVGILRQGKNETLKVTIAEDTRL